MTPAAWAYMVRCPDGSLYSGWTNDLSRRLRAHQTGRGARYTRMRGAGGTVTLAYAEACPDKSAALRREAALKRLSKPEKEALAAGWAAGTVRLRAADAADLPALTALYNWYIEHSTAIFQSTPAAEADLAAARQKGPCLLAEGAGDRLLGFAWAHPWAEKDGFAWDAEATVYCAPDRVGQGVGRRLYAALHDALRAAGYHNVYARVTHPNPGSEAFHRAFGFVRYGLEPHTAFKGGQWLDLGYWRLELAPPAPDPAPPRPLPEIKSE